MRGLSLRRIRVLLLGTGLLVLTSAGSAFALSLDEAKAKGLVGETQTGYLAAVGNADSQTSSLINDINAKRRAKYQEIAAKNGTPVSAVEALAGKKAVAETPSGQYIQTPSGAWQKK